MECSNISIGNLDGSHLDGVGVRQQDFEGGRNSAQIYEEMEPHFRNTQYGVMGLDRKKWQESSSLIGSFILDSVLYCCILVYRLKGQGCFSNPLTFL